MAITVQKNNQLKAIAILMMLCLHLFNRDYKGLFQPLVFVGSQPLSYYISLFCDACVPMFAFVSGYGLYFKFVQKTQTYKKDNFVRVKKLYINYWIILFLFAVLLGSVLNKEGYPGSFTKLVLNISGLDPSYNGAWWFFTIYVLFVFTSSFWFQMLDKINPYGYFIVLLIIYLAGFYFRIYKTYLFANNILSWFHRESALYLCTLFQFMLGAFALKYDWNKKISILFQNLKLKNLVVVILMGVLVVFHALVPNFIVAPFTALAFIFLFVQLDLPNFIETTIDFVSKHSTNMWLIHMFFYLIFFQEFVYGFRYAPVIFFVLVTMCIASSYIVSFINDKIQKRI